MRTARTFGLALVAACCLFPLNGNITQAKTHVTQRIILRPFPRKQWVQVVNNVRDVRKSVRDVRKSVGELKVGNQKSASSMQNLRSEIHSMRGQMQLEENVMVGALAALLFLIFPVLRKSTVTEVRNTIRRNLQTNKIRNNILSPLRPIESRQAFAGATAGPGFNGSTVPNDFGANTAQRFTPVQAIALIPVQQKRTDPFYEELATQNGFDHDNDYGTPLLTGFATEDSFNLPMRNGFTAPTQLDSAARMQNGFDAPMQNGFDAPMQHGFDAPMQHGFDAPMRNGIDAQHGIASRTHSDAKQFSYRVPSTPLQQAFASEMQQSKADSHADQVFATPVQQTFPPLAHIDNASAVQPDNTTTQDQAPSMPPYMQNMKWELTDTDQWDVDRLMDEVFSPKNTRSYGYEDYDGNVHFDSNETVQIDALRSTNDKNLSGVTRHVTFNEHGTVLLDGSVYSSGDRLKGLVYPLAEENPKRKPQ